MTTLTSHIRVRGIEPRGNVNRYTIIIYLTFGNQLPAS